MVFQITKKDTKVRMAEINKDVWPFPSVTPKLAADLSERIGFAEFLTNGRDVFIDVLKEIYADTNEQFATDVKTPN